LEILSGANQPKDIVSKEYVDGQINNHVHDADEIPCESKTLKLGNKEYKISKNLQNALENLLDYVYMNASGVLDLQTNLKSVSDTVSKIPAYKGGTGISVAGDTIGHSNNILPGMVGTGEILTPDFGDTVYTTWFSYDAQGHVTQSGTGGFVIPTVQTDDALSDTSTKPLQNKTVKAKFDAVDSQISSLGIDNNNQWKKINSKADADHTHNYAGSSSAGGSAITANALTSKNIGSDTQPVYFNSTGTPSPVKYILGDASTKTIKTATAVGSAAWVNLATGQKYIPDMAFISYWNGAVNDQGGSNLKYCNKGAFGTAATKGVDTDVTSGSANLVTSGGVYSKLYQYRPMAYLPGTSGKVGYVCFAELKVTANYNNMPIEFKISSRGRFICNVTVRFANKGNTDPDIEILSFCGEDYKIYAYKSATSTWKLYALKSESYDSIYVLSTYRPGAFSGTITYPGTFVATKHTGTTTNPVVSASWGYAVKTAKTADNAIKWNGLTDDTMTANTTDTRLMVLNGNKVQHRQIDTLPFLSSKDLSQSVLFTSSSDVKTATIDNLFTDYSLVWCQFVGSKTTHTHILPLAYLKSKGSLTLKDSGTPINILYVSDTQIRWFEYQGQGAETYTSVTIVKII